MWVTREDEMDSEPTRPTGSRRARVALLLAGAVLLLAAAAGVGVVLGAASGHDRQPGGAATVAAAGTTPAGQDTSMTLGGDDVRSGVETYDIGNDYAYQTVHVWRYDTISGSADSPTDMVIDRLHVLDPPGPNGQPFVAAMVHTICP
jgi:hypothetical protein